MQATAANATDSDADGDATNDVQAPATITITDDDTAPSAPRSVTVANGDTKVGLQWIDPDPSTIGTSSTVLRYEVRYSEDTLDADDEWTTISGGGGARTHEITGLTNGTNYNIELRAVTAAGGGTAATATGAPVAPPTE